MVKIKYDSFPINYPNLFEVYKLTKERMAATIEPKTTLAALIWLKPTMDHLINSGLHTSEFDVDLSEEVARGALEEWCELRKIFGLEKIDPFITC